VNIYRCILGDCDAFIPVERVRRNAVTCSPEHQKQLSRQRRSERAEKFCRLCGRPAKRKRASEAVPRRHNDVQEVAAPAICTSEDVPAAIGGATAAENQNQIQEIT